MEQIEKIKGLLKEVTYPGYQRDIVSFGIVSKVELQNEEVRIQLKFTTSDRNIQEQIKTAIRNKLAANGYSNVRFAVQEKATASVFQKRQLAGVRFTLAVASGKGGVGKSTIAANLAAAFQTNGYRTGLLDLDVYGPSLPITMHVQQVPEVLPGNRLKPVEKYGLQLMSLGLLLGDDSPVIWRGAMVTKMVTQFLFDVAWENLDILVLDLPPGTGDVQLTLVQQIALTGAVLVTTPQQLALMDVQRGANMFQKVNAPVLGIIENMSYYLCPSCGHRSEIFSHGGGEKESRRLQVPLLGKLPLTEALMEASEKGKPLVLEQPDHPAAEEIRHIATKLAESIGMSKD